MNLAELILALVFSVGFFHLFFYVLFDQTTLRRLRKNPETKSHLGVEFASGWDTFNIAQALSLPKFITRKPTKSPMVNFYANRDALDKNTNVFDKCLVLTFYWLFVVSIFLLFISGVV